MVRHSIYFQQICTLHHYLVLLGLQERAPAGISCHQQQAVWQMNGRHLLCKGRKIALFDSQSRVFITLVFHNGSKCGKC